jgi:hypothetical protein
MSAEVIDFQDGGHGPPLPIEVFTQAPETYAPATSSSGEELFLWKEAFQR